MKTRRLFLILLLPLLALSIADAQTQHGIVKTKGRLGTNGKVIPGMRLSGATVTVKGRSNKVVSGNNGTFSFKIPAQKYYLQSVQKQGYALVDLDMLSREYAYSANPLTLVMEDPEKQKKELKEITDKLNKTLKEQRTKLEDEITRLKEENKISQKEYETGPAFALMLCDKDKRPEEYEKKLADYNEAFEKWKLRKYSPEDRQAVAEAQDTVPESPSLWGVYRDKTFADALVKYDAVLAYHIRNNTVPYNITGLLDGCCLCADSTGRHEAIIPKLEEWREFVLARSRKTHYAAKDNLSCLLAVAWQRCDSAEYAQYERKALETIGDDSLRFVIRASAMLNALKVGKDDWYYVRDNKSSSIRTVRNLRLITDELRSQGNPMKGGISGHSYCKVHVRA